MSDAYDFEHADKEMLERYGHHDDLDRIKDYMKEIFGRYKEAKGPDAQGWMIDHQTAEELQTAAEHLFRLHGEDTDGTAVIAWVIQMIAQDKLAMLISMNS